MEEPSETLVSSAPAQRRTGLEASLDIVSTIHQIDIVILREMPQLYSGYSILQANYGLWPGSIRKSTNISEKLYLSTSS